MRTPRFWPPKRPGHRSAHGSASAATARSPSWLPLIIAEELDADWSRVRIVPAPPLDQIYGNPGFGGMMYTAGSNAVTSYYRPLRIVGAQARRVLLDNAARKWGVPVEELTTEPSVVVHAKSGRRLSYGDIAQFAELPAKAPDIKPEQLKKPADFRLIGKDVMRVELPKKVNGTAIYGIDVQVPGMLYGTVLRAPVEGSVPNKIDEAKAKAVPGVVSVIRLPHGVGVVADTAWAALKARQALIGAVTWTRTGTAWGFDSDKGLDAFAADAKNLNRPARDWSQQGNARAAIQSAASTLEAEYRCDYAYHAQMEPLNAVALSKEAGRPVKVMWTREDDVHNGRFRPISAHYLRAGFDASGKITAWHHRIAVDRVGPYMDPVRFQATGGKDFIAMLGGEPRGYEVPHQLVEHLYRDTGVRTNPLRGISFLANKFAAEAFMDEMARKRGVDPLAFRLDLLKGTPRGYKA